MTRATLPDPSARADWLLAGLMEPSVIGPGLRRLMGRDDDNTDAGTDTTIPDDDVLSLVFLIQSVLRTSYHEFTSCIVHQWSSCTKDVTSSIPALTVSFVRKFVTRT